MANDGQIVFEVTADGKRAIADIKDITRAIQQESKKWDDAAEQSTDNISNSFNGMLKKLVAGFSAVKIGKALLDIGKDAVEAASALEEVQNVVDVTFGADANKIDQWAKQAGTQFGLTETQAKKFTSTLGAMMKSAGMSGSEITDMSTDLAGLAADMASFYNLDFETAFQKIRSGISGETEPLKQLGINMSVANLEAYALSKGITKAFNDMSQGEQTMLRYQYLMQATADAQGDFARTSDGYANSIRKAETAVEGIKTQLGQLLIGPASEALEWLNGFLGKLTTPPETTVLDDFNNIDIDTEGKLAQIEKVAGEARLLTSELDDIGGSKADKAGSKIQQMADAIGGIDLSQSKASVVGDFIATLSENINTLADLQGTDAKGAEEWLRGIGQAADSLDPADAEGWAKLIDSIKEGLPGFENTDFGASFFAVLGDGFGDVEGKTSVLEWAVEALGDKTNKTAEEQALWLETCKQLVKTIPGLNSIINTETGEIKGGTQAVKDYIDAWEKGQEKLALLGALEQKESALASYYGTLPGLQLDAALAEKKLRDNRKTIDNLLKKYGLTDYDYTSFGGLSSATVNEFGITEEDADQLNNLISAQAGLRQDADEANAAYKAQKDALEEAKQALKEYREAIEEEYGSVEAATAAGVVWSDTTIENAKTVVNALKSSLQELDDYAQGVRDSVEKAVDKVVGGFDKIKRPTDDADKKMRDALEDETKALAKYETALKKWKENGVVNLEKMGENYGKLSKEEQKAYDALVKAKNKQTELNEEINKYKPSGMLEGLQDQVSWMQEYMDNLEKAEQMGLSADLLGALADGSEDSALYLKNLVADPEAAKLVDTQYKDLLKKKKEFTDALTGQQLEADPVFTKMQEDAKKAVEALGELPGAAGKNAEDIVNSITSAIRSNAPELEEEVNSILKILAKLSNLNINIDFGGFGSIPIVKPSSRGNVIQGEFETGLNYVPFDGFLASLHAGEGILTAEENRVWQKFKDNGNTAFDYDTIGGVMRDNIKPGGNVYLDGRVVGNVISEQQGRAYRQLQRSGWQG